MVLVFPDHLRDTAGDLQDVRLHASGLTSMLVEVEHSVCNEETGLEHETETSGAANAVGTIAVGTATSNVCEQ